MSILVHDCTDCGHRTDHHRQGIYTVCACCQPLDKRDGHLNVDPTPRLWETYDAKTLAPEPLVEPGATRNAGTVHKTTACRCAECVAEYARLTA